MNESIYRQEIEDWDKNAAFYLNENKMPYQQKINRKIIYDFYNLKASDKVLEVGGGVVKVPSNTVILDFSPKMIEACKNINRHDQCVLASAHKIPFPDNTFDAVVCNGLFHHVKIQGLINEVARECYRVLKPGGKLCIFDRANNLAPRLIFKLRQPLKKIYKPSSTCSTRNETEFLDSDIEIIKTAGFIIARKKFIINVFYQHLNILANGIFYLFGHKTAFWFQKLTWPVAYVIETILPFKILCAEQVIVMKKE